MPQKAIIILDGGFVKKKLKEQLDRFPRVADVQELRRTLMDHDRLEGFDLLRVYYYDAPPLQGSSKNPIDGQRIDFSKTEVARQNQALLDSLELEPDFAVRRGTLLQSGWKLGKRALKRLRKEKGGEVSFRDLEPDLAQKGVDIRIGLDIASIALKRTAEVLVLVTGDSDFVPPMKFARKEGLKVYLHTLGHGVRRELKAHADYVF